MEDTGKGLGYFSLGLGAGVGVGMLLAPRSGTATRNYLQTKTREGADYRQTAGSRFGRRGERDDRTRQAEAAETR